MHVALSKPGKPALAIIVILLISCGLASAQDQYYFHTKSSHGLAFTGGRTAKLSYMYQMNRRQQFKLSTTWVRDTFNLDENQVTSNMYNLKFQLQFTLINIGRFFLNAPLGIGGYYLRAVDVQDVSYDEWRIDFVTGGQAEFYLLRNSIALTFDYDIYFTPWSRIYEFVHVPTVGLTFFFY